MSEEPKTTDGVVRFKNETVPPATRTGFALLMGAGILTLGLVGQAFSVLDAAVSILVVAAFHIATHWSEPSGSDKSKPSRLAGTLATAQADMPVLQIFLSRGSRLVEVGKGLIKGIGFLLAKGFATFVLSVITTPVNILDQSLPWLGISLLIIAAAAAWHWDGAKALAAPLLKIRDTDTATTAKDS